MAPRRADISHVGTLIIGGDLEPASGAGRILLEDQGDVFSRQARLLVAAQLGSLELRGHAQQEADLV
ncbi:hypothetical protein D3C72_2565120 [compost metagenome]